MPATFDLLTLNGLNGFSLKGATSRDANSLNNYSVNKAGDINNDGMDDIVIGAPHSDFYNTTQVGASYVIFGKAGAWNSSVDLTQLEGTNGFILPGFIAGEQSGNSVAGAGDVNDDGMDDLIIGAPFSNNGNGAAYVIFGSPSVGGAGIFNLSMLDGSNGFSITGAGPGEQLGFSVNTAGDLNNDGIADIIIGAPYNSAGTGKTYVIFGKTSPWTASFSLAALNGQNGFYTSGYRVGGAFIDGGGSFVSSLGDINHDGIDDCITLYGNPAVGGYVGGAHIIFGQSNIGSTGNFAMANLDGNNGFSITGYAVVSGGFALATVSAAPVGDINLDGIPDFIISSATAGPGIYAGTSPGGAWVIFGNPGPWNATFDLSTLSGSNGFSLPGIVNADSQCGKSVDNIGDFNGDGIYDLIVGVPSSFSTPYTGKSYVVFGKKNIGSTGTFDFSSLNGNNGFTLSDNIGNGLCGFSVSSAGDLNADGVGDLLIAAPSGPTTGTSYVVFGYGAPQLLTNQLTLSQGEHHLMTANNLNATNLLYPNAHLLFMASHIQHGTFIWKSNGTALNSFYQSDVSSSQILFAHDGTPNIPEYSISVSTPAPVTTPLQAASIFFNFAPFIENNTLAITRGESVILSTEDLSATDPDNAAPGLIFTVSNVLRGQFSLVSAPNKAITTFLQSQISAGDIQFTENGETNAPSYEVSVSDGRVSNIDGPQPAFIKFDAGTLPASSTSVSTGVAVGSTLGIAALIGVGSLYLRNQADKQLEKAIKTSGSGIEQESATKNKIFYPIVKKIYEQIKITGCLGHLGSETANAFVTAMQALIDEMQKLGMDLELEKMPAEHQSRLLNEMVRQIRIQTGASGSCARFFKTEVTPIQIQDKAAKIARYVQMELNDTSSTHIETQELRIITNRKR